MEEQVTGRFASRLDLDPPVAGFRIAGFVRRLVLSVDPILFTRTADRGLCGILRKQRPHVEPTTAVFDPELLKKYTNVLAKKHEKSVDHKRHYELLLDRTLVLITILEKQISEDY